MPLLKGQTLVDDEWIRADDDEALPDGAVIVSLERWQAECDTLRGRNAPIGIALKHDQFPNAIADDLNTFDLVALEFPAYTNGRAYSSARLLRQRYKFEGEIRATGDVLIDQYAFMLRCGFDAFEIENEIDVAAWQRAAAQITAHYQPAADGVQAVWAKRHGVSDHGGQPPG